MNNSQPFIDAVIQAATTRANLGASPAQTAANAGQITNLQNLAGLKFTAANAGIAGQALAGNASTNADQAEAQRVAAAQLGEMDLRQKLAQKQGEIEAQDPKNYKRVLNEAGGYTFLNGEGKPITVNEYSRATNTTINDALKDSQDSSDIEFSNDYKDTMELGQIMATGNQKALDKFYEDRPGLKEYVKESGIKTWDQYVQAFRGSYRDRFSQAQSDNTAGRPMSNLNIRG